VDHHGERPAGHRCRLALVVEQDEADASAAVAAEVHDSD
jgi:hypothetical protein